jgi:hypothetical protein
VVYVRGRLVAAGVSEEGGGHGGGGNKDGAGLGSRLRHGRQLKVGNHNSDRAGRQRRGQEDSKNRWNEADRLRLFG